MKEEYNNERCSRFRGIDELTEVQAKEPRGAQDRSEYAGNSPSFSSAATSTVYFGNASSSSLLLAPSSSLRLAASAPGYSFAYSCARRMSRYDSSASRRMTRTMRIVVDVKMMSSCGERDWTMRLNDLRRSVSLRRGNEGDDVLENTTDPTVSLPGFLHDLIHDHSIGSRHDLDHPTSRPRHNRRIPRGTQRRRIHPLRNAGRVCLRDGVVVCS